MKKISLLSLIFIFLISSPVQALSWAYPFVVWDGKVYEVKEEEILQDNEIGKAIGEVKTQTDDMTGNYYGDASNFYPKGTQYYEITGTSTSTAIAVEADNLWVKAEYVHKVPFHIMNVLTSFYFIAAIVGVVLIISGILIRNSKFVAR
ncbi:hypothetical protein [Metaplanococcus flavidus]|uniref:Uncharacterized protein n=1 Tax=Metaplanococcus flavidus TaxID=569883 RepID=A0ABW3LDZ4_9BACL